MPVFRVRSQSSKIARTVNGRKREGTRKAKEIIDRRGASGDGDSPYSQIFQSEAATALSAKKRIVN